MLELVASKSAAGFAVIRQVTGNLFQRPIHSNIGQPAKRWPTDKPMHATEFLKAPNEHEISSVVVLSGAERALKQAVLSAIKQSVIGDEDDDASITHFAGKDAEYKTVSDELLTVSMWGDRRVVVIDEADPFITDNRAALEKYVAKSAKKSVLILDVKSWRSNTKLAKAITKSGLTVSCEELEGSALNQWIRSTAENQYGKQITRDAANLLAELTGSNLGMLDQELSKLASYVGEKAKIDSEDVRKLVGGWKAETTWNMIGAVRENDMGQALSCLEKLLYAGEAAPRILGGINFSFRKLAIATEQARQGSTLTAALKSAGVFYRDIDDSAKYLRRIGRPRAERLLTYLTNADSNLKGGSTLSDRMILEQLLLQLGGAV